MKERRATRLYFAMSKQHLDDRDLERYNLGQIEDQDDLAQLEEHYLWLPALRRARGGDRRRG